MGNFINVPTLSWLFDTNLNRKNINQFAAVLEYGTKGNTLVIYVNNGRTYEIKKVFNLDDVVPTMLAFRLS